MTIWAPDVIKEMHAEGARTYASAAASQAMEGPCAHCGVEKGAHVAGADGSLWCRASDAEEFLKRVRHSFNPRGG